MNIFELIHEQRQAERQAGNLITDNQQSVILQHIGKEKLDYYRTLLNIPPCSLLLITKRDAGRIIRYHFEQNQEAGHE